MANPALKLTPAAKKNLFDKPFALSIGPQRSGTSWLDRYLRARGDICMPTEVKEVFFFDKNYDRGPEFYRKHFRPGAQHRLVMEMSATSFDTREAPQRVYETFGRNVRLLCPLRNPVNRSYSLYQHYKRFGLVRGSLKEACLQNPHILTSSHYAHHLGRWLDYFGPHGIHFVFQEDMETQQAWFVTQICNALQIPLILPTGKNAQRFNTWTNAPFPKLAKAAYDTAAWLRKYQMYPVINTAKKMGLKQLLLGIEKNAAPVRDIPERDRQWLEDKLSPHVDALEKMIGPVPQWS